MSDADLTVSIVICAYTEERWSDLAAAVAAVRAQSVTPDEIVVVIDYNDALLERARTLGDEVIVVPNAEQRGLSGARNSGIAASQGAIIAFLDDDAVPVHDWLARIKHSYTSSDVISVGGAIEPMWLTQRPAWLPDEFDWVVGCTYRGMPLTTSPVRNLIGANISFRREVFGEVGGFRNGIGRIGKRPLGCEETELCIRAQRRWPDRVVLYVPSAKVDHRVPASRATWSYFRARCYGEGLSKATITSLIGSQQGLASERTYTMYTLPMGVLRSLGEIIWNRDLSGFGRAGAIVAGLIITVSGYAVGTVHWRLRKALRRERNDQRQIQTSTSVG